MILYRFCGQEAAAEEYTVTFELNYGDEGTYKAVTVEDGDTISRIGTPSRSGYSFKGWYTKATGGEKFDFRTEITKDITLYAQWTKNSSGGGGGSSHSHTYSAWTPNGDGTHTRSYNCGHVGRQSANCSYTYTLVSEEGHTKTCSVCSHEVTEYHEYDNYKCACGKDITPTDGETENPVAMIGTTGYATAQAAVDAVRDGETIILLDVETGHGDINLSGLAETDVTIIGEDLAEGKVEVGMFYTTAPQSVARHIGLTIENIAFPGTNGGGYRMEGLGTGNEDLTIKNCSFAGKAYIHLGDNHDHVNALIENCTFTDISVGEPASTNSYSAIIGYRIDGMTIKGCTFTNIEYNAAQLFNRSDSMLKGAVLIEGNTINGTGDRVFRFGPIDTIGTLTIKDNTIVSDGDGDGQLAKATSLADGSSVALSGNTWNGYTDEQIISHNGVWMLPVVMADNAADFVAAMKKVPAGTDKITLVDAEGNTGMVIAPDGEDSTITVSSKEGLLYLDTLFGNWEACFTNGSGNDYGNYAPADGGKGVDYYYGGRWTINLEADIDLNNDTIDPIIIKHPVSAGAPTFDGNNHTIKNAKIVTDAITENEAGLFNASEHVALKNLKLDNIHVTGSNVGNSCAGILSGSVNPPQAIQNITITNSSVTGGKYTGGVVGYGYTDITNCSLTNVTVKGGYKLGGIIGYICASGETTGDVTGNTLTDCTVDGIGGGVYAGGKSEYVAGYVVGNYNCDGICNNNSVVNMTTSATGAIGKIEAGKNVEQ